MRIAVVTPYFNESRDVLQRCIASVQSQSVTVDHILVADGNPQYWVETHANVTHIVLRKRSADFGDTPRSVGFVMGMRSGYDIVQFLDADNVLMPDHFKVTLQHFYGRGETEYPDLVVARRQLLRTDGSILDVSVPQDDALTHIDTNCYVFYRTAFSVGLKWSLIPRQISFMGDQAFFAMLTQTHTDLKLTFNQTKTVGYTCLWEIYYRMAGEEPPANCKNLKPHIAAAREWWRNLDSHRKDVIERALGLPILIPRDDGMRQS
jgi:glycosyltransferase involved in cell wall biosynthesis